MIRTILCCTMLIAVISCHSGAGSSAAADSAARTRAFSHPRSDFSKLAFGYPKDPSCGMPLTAGVEDTVSYNGKLYGFCSKECKDEFMKDPAGNIAKLK